MSGSDMYFDSHLALEEEHAASFTYDLFDLPPADLWNFVAESSATTGRSLRCFRRASRLVESQMQEAFAALEDEVQLVAGEIWLC